jgi:MoaA/NifB/PqqE/SkfB family radical SAM enzyme
MCLDCNSTASSLIFKEEVDKGIKSKEYPIIYSGQDPNLLLEQMKEHIHTVENLSFSGGEPTIHPQHWDLLNYMVDNNLKPNLNYFTNFSKLVYKGQDIVDLWNHFPNIRVHVGFDAMEEAGDYFRYKMNWNQTIENVKRVNLEAPHVKLVVTVTFTWMTALNAVKMIHWFSENFPKLEIAFNLVIHQHLNMQLAPEYKKKQIEKALESLLTIDQTNYIFDRKMVTGYISYLWEKDKSNEFAQALKWVKEMDDWRGHDFRNVFPEHQDIKYEDYF